VWVRQLDTQYNPIGSAFDVTPQSNDIDGLKDAIKTKWDAIYHTKLDVRSVTIYTAKGGDGAWQPVADVSTALSSNTQQTPYGIVGFVGKVWVRQLDTQYNPIGGAFEVTPQGNHIDGLKDAIKTKWDANKPTKLDALGLTICAKKGYGAWQPVADPGTVLANNTAATAYGFVVP
jgi:hypothetical protein